MLHIYLAAAIPADLFAELGPEAVEGLLDNLAMAARAKWINLAKQGLHSTEQEYVDGIQEIESGRGVRTVTLVGFLPNALENGLEAFDLRVGILKSSKAHMNAQGQKYMAIPFRHSVPGTVGQAGPAMGMRYGPQGALSRAFAAGGHFGEAEAAIKGKALYQRVKKLGVYRSKGGGAAAGGEAVSSPGKGKSLRLPPQSDLFPLLAPWHKTDIYAGMIKQGDSRHRQYMTFRTISEANPQGWIHPGLEPRRFAEQVSDHINNLMPRAISAALGK